MSAPTPTALDGWNAAIEAAEKVCMASRGRGYAYDNSDYEDACRDCAKDIRALQPPAEIAARTRIHTDDMNDIVLRGLAAEEWRADKAELVAALRKEEIAHDATIRQRDAAEEALNQVYNAVMDRSPEWSNLYGFDDAVRDIEERVMDLLKALRDACSTLDFVARDVEWRPGSTSLRRVQEVSDRLRAALAKHGGAS